MKLLFENWREYLNEEMKTIDEIDRVFIDPPPSDEGQGLIKIYANVNGESENVGLVYFTRALEDDIEGSPCWDPEYKIYRINDVQAKQGYGPLLYDLVIEYASWYGDGAGSSPNFGTIDITAAAEAVWKKYHTRADVSKEYLPACKAYIFSKKSPDLMQKLKRAGKLEVKGR